MTHHHKTDAEIDAVFDRINQAGRGLWQLTVVSLNGLLSEVRACANGGALDEDAMQRVVVLTRLWEAICEAPANAPRGCFVCEGDFSTDGEMPQAFGIAKAGMAEGDVVAVAICEQCTLGGQSAVMERVTAGLSRCLGQEMRYLHPAGHA